MKVIVTGGEGLVGHSLKKICPEFTFLTRRDADLRNFDEVDTIFSRENPHVVIHLASHVGGVYDNMKHNYTYLMDNTRIHMNIVEACRKYNVKRLVNILSTCIFPDKDVHYPLSSNQLHMGLPHESNIGYAYSKRFLHIASSILSTTCPKIQVINLIPTNLYGEHDQYNIERAHVIPALIHKTYNMVKERSTLNIRGSGNARRQFVFSEDFARIIHHFTKYDIDHDVLCIVSPPQEDEVSIQSLANTIVEIFEGKKSDIQFDKEDEEGQVLKTTNEMELKTYIPDFSFTPLREGLKQVVSYFVENYNELRR